MDRRSRLVAALACALTLAAADTRLDAQARQAAATRQKAGRRVHRQDQGIPLRSRESRRSSSIICPHRRRYRRRSKFLGHMPGSPGVLTHAADIHRYFAALDKASDRVSVWNIGKTEEGRDMIVAAIADEATIRSIDKYKAMLAQLTDARKTDRGAGAAADSHGQAVYYFTSGMHSPETGGPEMLMEMAYRLAVEDTPFIQNIRTNVITLITPVVEVDGREKMVDTYYFNKKQPEGAPAVAAHVLGQVRPARQQSRRDGPVPRAHAEHRARQPRLEAHGPARPARGADLLVCVDRHRDRTTSRSIPSRSTSGGCSPRTM